MSSFDSVRQDRVVGNLTMFDRLVFKGHLSRVMADGAFQRFLSSHGVPLKDFKDFVGQATADAWRYYQVGGFRRRRRRGVLWPQPNVTRGEARAIGKLAAERG